MGKNIRENKVFGPSGTIGDGIPWTGIQHPASRSNLSGSRIRLLHAGRQLDSLTDPLITDG